MAYLYGRRLRGGARSDHRGAVPGALRAPFERDRLRRASRTPSRRPTAVVPEPASLRAASPTLQCCTSASHPRRSRRRALDALLRAHPLRAAAEPATRALSPVNGAPELPGPLGDTTRRIRSSSRAWPGSRRGSWEDERRGRPLRGRAVPHLGHGVQPCTRSSSDPDAPRARGRASRRAYGFLRDAPAARGAARTARQSIAIRSLGGWCFSDGAHRWPVSDCTAEALIAVLAHPRHGRASRPRSGSPIERLRRRPSASSSRRQNADGGFGTYERRRGSPLLEALNPVRDVHATA